MIADSWDGQAVYRSVDGKHWQRQPENILSGRGTRCEDHNRAHHADVEVINNHAYMIYFVHPGQTEYVYDDGLGSAALRRSSIQAAMLKEENGRLVAYRDEPFDFYLPTLDESQNEATSSVQANLQ